MNESSIALLAVVAQAVAHAGREALVGDADVLADPEARRRRESVRAGGSSVRLTVRASRCGVSG